MIEDDLRLLMQSIAIPVYSRLIPPRVDEALSVQVSGGYPVKAGIRRASHTVTILSVSRSKANAMRNLAIARDFLITHIPADVNGTHYYTAVPLADGNMLVKSPRGPTYIYHVTLEVVRQL